MLSKGEAIFKGAVVAALCALPLPAVAVADGPPHNSMHQPKELEVGWKQYGSWDDNGTEPNEPVTPGSDSYCEDTEQWTLDSTDWYSFTGTGGPVVVRLEGTYSFGMVLYQADGVPTVEDGLACARSSPRRFEVDTEAGRRYLIQIGDWEQEPQILFSSTYRLNLAAPTQNGDRAHALPLLFGRVAQVDNFGSQFDETAPFCVHESRVFFGGRGAWARVEVPEVGTVHVDLEPEEFESWSLKMITLFAASGTPRLPARLGPSGSMMSGSS